MNKNISTETSQKIKNMSLLCAILVASIHIDWPVDTHWSAGWLIGEILKDGVARIAVPYFFVVSGFFIARHFDENRWLKHEIKKRVRSLIIPYFIWSIVAVVASLPLSIMADIMAHRPFGDSIFILHGTNWLRIFGLDLCHPPTLGPLWYVRCLMLFILTAFLFKWGVGRLKRIWLLMAFIFLLLCNHMVCAMIRDFLCYGYSASGIFYFSVGVAIHCLKIKEPCRCCAIICGIAGFSLLAVRLALVCRESFLLADVGILTIPFVLYFIWYFIPAVSLPDWLTSCSFPIFLIHTIVFQWFATGLKQLPIGELSQAMLTFVFGVFASLTITMLLRRSYPKCSVALFGGR